ncbi:MAG: zinc-ribbon domain-containing protein [Paracoccaceae bacterium]
MRLICPNCDAQYEVNNDAIPDGGRDVQCSNCGHAWFQMSPEAEAAMTAEEELFDAPSVGLSQTAGAAPIEVPAPPPVTPPQTEAADDGDEAEQFDSPSPLQRRTLDESLLEVLREEAERESTARRTEEPQQLETQTDLGLENVAPATAAMSPAARRIAQLKGIDPDASPLAPSRTATRRELLPDIEEINSTLRASSDRKQADADSDALPDLSKPRRSAFRSGFVLMILIAVMLVLAYVMAPKIALQIPGAADAMAAYVAKVDSGRLLLDGLMQKAIGVLHGLTGSDG